MTTKITKSERQASIESLREDLKPGDTIYCILRHRAASGMHRVIQPIIFRDGQPWYLGYNVARAIGASYDRNKEGVIVKGCGFDTGWDLVYNIGRVLWPNGFECIGEKCMANDHANGDRDYTPHLHIDGGYALRCQWL